MDFLSELEWRGALDAATDREALAQELAAGPVTLYAGFDPTASSLHAGSLLPIMGLARFQRAGHRPIALAGGATGMVGDPSGRDAERELLDQETLDRNVAGIRGQLERLLDFSPGPNQAVLVNNFDWFAPIRFIEFLRDIGKHFSVNRMIQRDSVRRRLESREQGISYTEFSYVLLQAYDFLHLFREHDCRLQIGGSDQWGNIVAGIDLIRRLDETQAYGLTFPLLTNAAGRKFGKSEGGGNVWLDPERTSPYQFYQFWLRSDDADVIRYLKLWTFLEPGEIDALAATHAEAPEKRAAHVRLASEVTEFVHGREAADSARRASQALFGGGLDELRGGDWEMIAGEVPVTRLPASELENGGMPVMELLLRTDLADSKGSARREIRGGGVYMNGERVSDTGAAVSAESAREGRYLMLRKGKANYHLVVLER